MKNQNDLIISIVAIVLFLIIAGVSYGTRQEPVQPAAPTPVPLGDPKLPTQVQPVMANGLGKGGASAPTGGGGAAGGRRGGGKGGALAFGAG